MATQQQEIIERQRNQIANLLTRFNELNHDHQALLEVHNDTEKKQPASTKAKFSRFGRAMKKRFNSLTPQHSSNFNFTALSNDEVTFQSATSPGPADTHVYVSTDSGLEQNEDELEVDDKCTQVSIKHTTLNRGVQTKARDLARVDESASDDQLAKWKKKYENMKYLYDSIAEKHSNNEQCLRLREEQLNDVALQRNELRKNLKTAEADQGNLLHILELKSQLLLNPDIRRELYPRSSLSNASDEHLLPSDGTQRNPIIVSTPLNIGLPMLGVKSEEKKIKKSALTNDSLTLANKLMKVIQDKDAIIAAMAAELKQQHRSIVSERNSL